VPKRSAGLLVWQPKPVRVLLAHPGGPFFARRDDGCWSIPKGEYEPPEDALTAAYREFAEELGQPAPIGEAVPLGEARTSGKINTVWAVRGQVDTAVGVSNTFELEWPPGSARRQLFPEVDRADWFELAAARVKIFANQLPFLDRLTALVAEGSTG